MFAGADAVQVVSALPQNGPRFLTVLLEGMRLWMAEHGYTSIEEIRGALNLRHCPDPSVLRAGQLHQDFAGMEGINFR